MKLSKKGAKALKLAGKLKAQISVSVSSQRSRGRHPQRNPQDEEGLAGRFEPSSEEKSPETVFETAAFNRSATPPDDGQG